MTPITWSHVKRASKKSLHHHHHHHHLYLNTVKSYPIIHVRANRKLPKLTGAQPVCCLG